MFGFLIALGTGSFAADQPMGWIEGKTVAGDLETLRGIIDKP